MSKIIQKIDEFQKEMKAREEAGGGIPMDYSMMHSAGLLKTVTFRLPVNTVAMLDELYTFGPWSSKAEMLYEIIDEVIQEFLHAPDTGEPVREKFHQVAQAALDQWRSTRDEVAA